MARDVSIMFTLKDRFSTTLKNITNEQRKFKQETEMVSRQIEALTAKKNKIQLDKKDAEKSIRTMTKGVTEFDDKLRTAVKEKIRLKIEDEHQIADLNKQIKDVMSSTKKLNNTKGKPTIEVNDKASKTLDSIGGKIKSLGKGIAIGIAGAGAAATAGVGAGIYHSINLAGNMEQTQIAFETMLGNKGKADSFLNSLKQFAIATPFEYNDLTDSSKKMLAYGFKSDEIIPTLTAVGNASSGLGLGADGIDRITIALGQMKAKSKVSAEEMKQLAEAGIPAWDILAKATHTTTAELMKLAEKGAIPADNAIKALVKGMNQRFPDMMIKQSQTLFGLWSSMKDFANLNIFAAFGEGIKDGILPYMSRFVDGLTNNQNGLQKLQDKLKQVGKTMGDWVGRQAEGLYKYFDKLFNDPMFQNADLGGKIKIVLDDMYNSIKNWFDGGGGDSIKKAFEDTTKVAMDALVVVATDYVPKFAEIGLKIGGAMADGIAKSLSSNAPTATVDGQEYKLPQDPLFGGLENITDKMFGNSDNSVLRFLFSNDPLGRRKAQTGSKSRAMGVSQVPYDNYPIMAHEGERLLTKQEANKSNKGSITIAKLADQIVVREEADIEKIAKALVRELKLADLSFGGVPG
jgi:tape measure domain-containing protein